MINKKLMKRLSAVLLAATLCMSAVPGNVVYATEAEGTETTVETTETDTTEAETTTETTDETTETTETDTTTETTEELADDFIIPNDETGIPDKALYDVLLNAKGGSVDVNGDGKLSVGEAKEITEILIYLDGKDKIESFTNLSKYAPNISHVSYSDDRSEEIKATDPITLKKNDLEEIVALSKLNYLSVWGMKFEDASVLSEIDAFMRGVEFVNCSIPNVDFLNAENYSKLERLNFDGTPIEKLPDAVSSMKNLWYLHLSGCGIKELPTMTDFTELISDCVILDKNLLTKEELRAKLPAQITDEQIAKIAEEQKKEVECTLSVDATEIQYGETLKATIAIKNVGMPIENLYVEVRENGKVYFPTTDADKTAENGIYIESLAYGESKTLTYEIKMEDLRDRMYLYAEVKTENYSVYWQGDKEVSVKLPEDNNNSDNGNNNGSDNGGTDNNGGSDNNEETALDITVTDLTVANKEVVFTDDAPTAKIEISASVAGADAAKLADGDMVYMDLNYGEKTTGTFYLYYNAETKKLEGSTNIGGNLYSDGAYSAGMFRLASNWQVLSCTGDAALFTLKNNVTDKVSPVVNGVEILINGVAQTANKFTLKAGDVVTVRADVTDDSQILGMVQLYPNFEASKITTAQYIEMANAGNLSLTMRAGQYDLEAAKTLVEPFYEGEYQIYNFIAYDKNMNMTTYYADGVTSVLKTVAPNKANAAVVENEATTKDLNKVAANIATIIAKDGAVDAATKAKVEAAIKNGETISVDLTYSNVPANSVNSEVKADVQKKADAVYGKDTKLVYLDIAMTMTASKSGALGNLKELGEEISITVKLPEGLEAYKYFKVVRSHEKADGTVETSILDAVKNADGTITFKTDRFSTYAIAYSNTPAIGESGGTGDADMTFVYLALAVSAVAAVVVCKKTRKTA